MNDLAEVAVRIRTQRRALGLTQHELANKARVSRAIAELESGRLPELGFKKLVRILRAVELDLRLTTFNRRRPTLEDLVREGSPEE